MDIQYYIHGTTRGFGIVGTTDLKVENDIFMQRFYNGCRHIKELRIDLLYCNDKPYFCYTYVLPVTDVNGRDNSYFALTMRTDLYYKKPVNLYHLFDAFLYSYLVGTIIEDKGGTARVRVDNISTAKPHVESLKRFFELGMSEKDFATIKVQAQDVGKAATINLDDALDEQAVMHAIQQTGNASISRDYPSIATQKKIKAVQDAADQKVRQVQEAAQKQATTDAQRIDEANKRAENAKVEAQREFNTALAKARQEVTTAQQESQEAKSLAGRLRSDKQQLEKEKEDLEKEFKKEKENFEKEIEKTKENERKNVLKEFSNYLSNQATVDSPSPSAPPRRSSARLRSLLILLLVTINLVISISALVVSCVSHQATASTVTSSTTTNDKDDADEKPTASVEDNATLEGAKAAEEAAWLESRKSEIARIDISGVRNATAPLTAGKEYPLALRSPQRTPVQADGTWECIDESSKNVGSFSYENGLIYFVPTEPGEFTLVYKEKHESKDVEIVSRPITVVE